MTKRGETILTIIMCIVLVPPMFFGVMYVIGSGVDTIASNMESRDRCLKAATNGYDIKQCR